MIEAGLAILLGGATIFTIYTLGAMVWEYYTDIKEQQDMDEHDPFWDDWEKGRKL